MFLVVFLFIFQTPRSLKSGEWSYYIHDHLGNTRVVLDEEGDIKEYYDYYPYGMTQRENITGVEKVKYKFTGKELDEEGELDWYYFGARYYDPSVGRFLSSDPLADLRPSLTPYHYCVNNPLIYIDPFGLIEYRFNQNGEYMEEFDDNKDEISGVVYNYEDGQRGDILNRFNFNELTDQDIQAFNTANILLAENLSSGLFIDLNFENKINDLANKGLGDNVNKGIIGKYLYAYNESQSKGQMDYYTSHLTGNFMFYLAGNTAYNPMDAGNFLWGVGMSMLGFDYATVKMGSEVNAFFNAKFQNNQGHGITWGGDAPADQRAIRRGFFWYRIWRY